MDYLALTHQLAEAGEAFVLATVVRCEPPASARPGAKAVIRADGTMDGWVGGSCAQPLVIREAQEALRDGKPRLLRLSPTAGEGASRRPGLVEYLMTCHSGGTLEIFIEPVIPVPRLWVVGDTPICRTLATLGQLLGYRVDSVEPMGGASASSESPVLAALAPERGGQGRQTFVVVATMGTADEEALEAALRSPVAYVALVASPRRAEVLCDYLATRGLTPEQLQKLKAPAGLDIGAATPEEIALSIMAEIVQVRAKLPIETRTTDTALPPEATDPVCGMSVSTRDARFVAEHSGTTYYFCCAGCKAKFEAEPSLFATVRG
jgi:xanthine dehydrogenase accessory factor